MDFRVELDVFRGPLDLLLYLVRKHEVEIVDIPIAPITEQFLDYLAVLKDLDVNAVGDFLDMASTLVEIKSRMVLPRGGEVEDELSDPRQELVRQLLEYKKFKDAASMLEERSRDWQQRHGRVASDRPDRKRDLSQEELQEVELWDLVSAFGRIMRDIQAAKPSNIVYDDTPIHVYMAQINQRLVDDGRLAFRELFQPGLHKSALIGMFLAILELVRHHQVRTDQNHLFGEIWVYPGPSANAALDVAKVDTYEHGGGEQRGPE
jgi:segregation and condensation protein A